MTSAQRTRVLTFGGVALLLGVLAIALVRRHRIAEEENEAAERLASDRNASIPVTPEDPTWGAPTAPVTIVVFGDLQCPFLPPAVAALEHVKTHYGPAKVRIVWKNRPAFFHPQARPAAIAAHAVFLAKGPDAFWAFVDKALRSQAELGPPAYQRWAAEVGADLAQSERAKKKIDDDRAFVLHRARTMRALEDPPAIYINGMSPRDLGADTFEATRFDDLRFVIDKQLELAASVSPRSRVYGEMTSANEVRDARLERQGGTRAPHQATLQRIPVDNSPTLGPADAVVTLVELSDFDCPECKPVDAALRAAQRKFGSKVRLVWKNRPLPFEALAEAKAELAVEAMAQKGNNAFWQAHDMLFERDDLDAVAGAVGLDVASVRAAIESRRHKSAIDADQALATAVAKGTWSDEDRYPRYDSVDGGLTPLLVLNGMPLPEGEWTVIDSHIERAIATFDKEHGDIPAKDWYEHLSAKAAAPRPPQTTPPRSLLWKGRVSFAGERSAQRPDLLRAPAREALEAALARNDAPIHACHEAALRSNPGLTGHVFVEVSLDRAGAVRLAQDGGSSLPDPTVTRCVADAVKRIPFPALAEAPTRSFVAIFHFTTQ